MHRSVYLTLLGLPWIFLTGCATLLSNQYQEVAIQTNAPDASVYVDNHYVGTGKTVIADVEKDREVKQIRIDRKGYKSEYTVHYQQKKSPLKILSWVTAGAVIAAPILVGGGPIGYTLYSIFIPLFDNGQRSYQYSEKVAINREASIASKQNDQKHIFLNSTSFEIEEENLIIESYKLKDYQQQQGPYLTELGKDKLRIRNTIFNDALNNVLFSYGFIDTTQTILKKKTNTLYISANVTGLKIQQISKSFTMLRAPSRFLVSEASIEWTISDVYQQPKYQQSINSSSGEFALRSNYSSDNNFTVITASIEDAVTTSFLKFLKTHDVQKLLRIDAEDVVAREMMSILSADQSVQSLVAAREATVTIMNGDGHGSGCIIGKYGEIVTNYHVIAGASELTVKLNNDKEYSAEVIRYNEYADLALIKIKETFETTYKLPVKKNYTLGEEIYAIGTPTSIELGQTLSKGIISSEREQEGQEWIQSDVSVNPGNSGGALVNKQGELVGIVNSKLMGVGIEGISFCIPARDIYELLKVKCVTGIQ
ncbi:MAG: trypsin-like peptidase domain-containing protein [Cyclobacteriaceae bacterium]